MRLSTTSSSCLTTIEQAKKHSSPIITNKCCDKGARKCTFHLLKSRMLWDANLGRTTFFTLYVLHKVLLWNCNCSLIVVKEYCESKQDKIKLKQIANVINSRFE